METCAIGGKIMFYESSLRNFIENNFEIITKDPDPETKSRIRPFKLNDFQKRWLSDLCSSKNSMTNKCRQIGEDNITSAFLLLRMLHEPTNVFVVSPKFEISYSIFKHIFRFYNNLPDRIKFLNSIVDRNVKEIFFENGSTIKIARKMKNFDDEKIDILYVNEMQCIKHDFNDKLIEHIFPEVKDKIIMSFSGGEMYRTKVINDVLYAEVDEDNNLIKTPTYKLYNERYRDCGASSTYMSHNYRDAGRTEEWADRMKLVFGEKVFKQEFECEFV